MKFRTTILGTGRTAAGIEVPAAVVEALGASRKPPVHATINGYTYRSTVASMGGKYMLGVSNEVRRNAGVAAGDEIEIELVLDTQPREVDVPPDFAAALAADTEATRVYDALNYSNRSRYVFAINDAKTPETRQRRIEKSVAELHAGGPRR